MSPKQPAAYDLGKLRPKISAELEMDRRTSQPNFAEFNSIAPAMIRRRGRK